MPVNNNFPVVPDLIQIDKEYLRKLKETANFLMQGKVNCTGEVTLTAAASSTTVMNRLCTARSIVLLMPLTANAAALGAAGYIEPDSGEFVINHPNNAQTDRTFRYVIFG